MRPRFLFLLLFVFQCLAVFAQKQNIVSSGIITLKSNETTGFENLHFIGEKIAFKNVATNKQAAYLLADVYTVEDDNQQIVYKNGELIKPKTVAKPKAADTLYKPRYPAGIYVTKEDFIARKPTATDSIQARGLNYEREVLNYIPHNCFFYTQDDKKLKDVFAVSYKGHLYFQVDAILSNRNKTDRAQTHDRPNSFVRVLMGGDHYLYTEAELANVWAQGAAYGGIGGAVGGVLANGMVHGKGIVWDYKNAEFNIFKNCTDYNRFITAVYPEGAQECKNQQPEQAKVRNAIWKIK